jgi:alkaline phosphatase D
MFERAAQFRTEPVGDMVVVGRVEPRRVRLWMRSRNPGRITVRWWPEKGDGDGGRLRFEIPSENQRDNTGAVDIPGPDGGLAPACGYRYHVVHRETDRLIGKGRFETAPESPDDFPERFSIGLMSCNQPFTTKGDYGRNVGPMLRAVRRCLRSHNAKYVLMVGDQVYSDFPRQLSLFNPDYFQTVAPDGRNSLKACTPSQVRGLFHRHYRYYWGHPEWRALQAEFPSYPILDDHDIVDNWGSIAAHQQPEWQSVGEGARKAYQDYQHERIAPTGLYLPQSFHYRFSYGNTATFVMDLRSERREGKNGRLFSNGQMADLREFLETSTEKSVLFIVLSVPAIHIPRTFARLAARLPRAPEDFSDRWSSGSHLRDRDRFLKTIRSHQARHPSQLLVLVSGDIHIGCVHRIRWAGNGPCLYQAVSSGITHAPGPLVQQASKLLIRMNHRISTVDNRVSGQVRLLRGTRLHWANPFSGLNMGLIEVHRNRETAETKLRFLLYGHHGDRPVCTYRSPIVSCN